MAVEGTTIKELIYRISVQSKDLKAGVKDIDEALAALYEHTKKTGDEGEKTSKKLGDALALLAKDAKAPLNTLTKGIDDLSKAAINLGRAGSAGVGTFGGIFSGVLRSFGIGGVLAGAAIGVAGAGMAAGAPLAQQAAGYNARPSELQAFKATYGTYIQNTQGLFDYINTGKTNIASQQRAGLAGILSVLGLQGAENLSTPELSSKIASSLPAFAKRNGIAGYATLNSAAPGLISPYTYNQALSQPGGRHQNYLRLAQEYKPLDDAAQRQLEAQNRLNESLTSFSTAFIELASKFTPILESLTTALNFVVSTINATEKIKQDPQVKKSLEFYENADTDRWGDPFYKSSNSVSFDKIRSIQHKLESSGGKRLGDNPRIIGDYQISPERALEAYGLPINARSIAAISEKLKNPTFNEKTRDKIIQQSLAKYSGNYVWALASYHGWGKLNGKATEGIVGSATKNYLMNFFDEAPELKQLYREEYNNLLRGNSLGRRPGKSSHSNLAYSPNTNLMQQQDMAMAANNSTSNIMTIGTLNITTDAKNSEELATDISNKIKADNTALPYSSQWGVA